MTTLKNAQNYSRQKARRKFMAEYPAIRMNSKIHVHHKDGNPFNDDIENLSPMTNRGHMSLHNKGHKRNKRPIEKDMELLERWLIIYNDF